MYGTGYTGGTNSAGVIFRLNKNGTGYSVLHRFLGGPLDGARPVGALVEGDDGALLGCTDYGGSSFNGVVFKINRDGSGYAVLRSFVTTGGGGGAAGGGLIRGSDNLLYGTTQFGGGSGGGCVFALSYNPLPPRSMSLSVANQIAVVRFTGTSAAEYTVWSSPDLNSWSNLVTLRVPNSGRLTYTNSSPSQPAGYYRTALVQ